MRVAVIGTGYVGLTTALSLAYLGHEVVGVDLDETKVAGLNRGVVPFFEPHITDLLHLVRTRVRFTTRYEEAVPGAEIVFIAVGTPSLPDGRPDLSQVREAAERVGRALSPGRSTVVVNKSTVPVGSGNWVRAILEETASPAARFHVASNPEFLREGAAVHEALYPDRVVVGAEDEEALNTLYALYRPLLEQSFTPPSFLPRPEGKGAVPFIATDLASAELIKYAANAFLALKISFINEMAELAERVGADITQVARGIGLDSRIGSRFLQAGVGWGGSCFGKDTAALLATAREYGLSLPIIHAAREVNYRQRERVVERLLHELKILKGRTIGLLGLAFKPNTDDLRDAPALDIGAKLLERGVRVKAHDPKALENARRLGVPFTLVDTPEEVFRGADAVVLVTEWPEYRELEFALLKDQMRNPLILDGRNFLDKEALLALGYRYLGVGLPPQGEVRV
ncbi:MAG: UDP-glucose dehydrogenase family protein [Thermaceae bacterium]